MNYGVKWGRLEALGQGFDLSPPVPPLLRGIDMPATASLAKGRVSLLGGAILSVFFSSCRTIESEPEEPGVMDQATFALADLDGDGKVSQQEMAKFKHREGLAEFDLDNNQRISLSEWQAAKPSAPDTAEMFHHLDRDGDGEITEAEAVVSILESAPFVEAFRLMDTNGDGYLHWEEYLAGDAASLNVTLFSEAPADPAAPAPHPPAAPSPAIPPPPPTDSP